MTIDRITSVWGERTPYDAGTNWPVRVDAHLAEGLTEDDVDRWVQSASVLHSNGDALDIAVKDERIVGVRGRAVDRVNHGRLDTKDVYGWQANGQRSTHDSLIRQNGKLVETDWDTAMDRIVIPQTVADEQGPSAVGFIPPASYLLKSTPLAAIAHGGIGTNHLDGNTTCAQPPPRLPSKRPSEAISSPDRIPISMRRCHCTVRAYCC